MIEDALRECLAGGMVTQLAVETKRLADRQVSLDGEHGRSHPLFFAEYLTTAFVQAAVNPSDRIFRTLNLDCQRKKSMIRSGLVINN